eukprot:scaffold1.g5701.t1
MAGADRTALREGRCYAEVTPAPLELGALAALVEDPSAGAVATFTGTTRNSFQGKPTLKLEYEAYVPMAAKKLMVGAVVGAVVGTDGGAGSLFSVKWEVCQEACLRWDLVRIAIAHRTGLVRVGEASVVIAASSAHRRDALEACHWAIDELKATVPIWKKEFFEGGEVWKENAEWRALERRRRQQPQHEQGDGERQGGG